MVVKSIFSSPGSRGREAGSGSVSADYAIVFREDGFPGWGSAPVCCRLHPRGSPGGWSIPQTICIPGELSPKHPRAAFFHSPGLTRGRDTRRPEKRRMTEPVSFVNPARSFCRIGTSFVTDPGGAVVLRPLPVRSADSGRLFSPSRCFRCTA